jgi:hypothetical protein
MFDGGGVGYMLMEILRTYAFGLVDSRVGSLESRTCVKTSVLYLSVICGIL